MAKIRLDVLLVNRGLFETRSRAQAEIMAGNVLVDEVKIDKPGTPTKEDVTIRILGSKIPYVSRGGLKLAKALEVFPISVQDKVVADIGASTGGFTDCALQNGAQKVFAVDVGYGQLAWKLRQDARVVNLERTNVRFLKPEDLGELVDAATIDVAFISLGLVLPAVWQIVKDNGFVIALIKPQFEAGKENVGKNGVVKDAAVHIQVIEKVIAQSRDFGFSVQGLDFSPIKGPEGNIEYLLYLDKSGQDNFADGETEKIVEKSHQL
ncbi:MAG: TlyA family RNA methyltransferase [Phascolarctobacterium sp.]|nr:TlyA family RNA methyltransferase [Phascolarctobacterium sp.]